MAPQASMIPTDQLISVPVPRRGESYARLESRVTVSDPKKTTSEQAIVDSL